MAVDLPTLETPELQAPDTQDLELSLDRDSADAINGFGADTESVTASFDAAGMGFGKDVSALKPLEQPPVEKDLEGLPAESGIPMVDTEAINRSLAQVNDQLAAFDDTLASGEQKVEQTVASDGAGLSESVQRAISETAENTKKLVDRARNGGLVFG